jgi:nicotinamide-nucleotide amidase
VKFDLLGVPRGPVVNGPAAEAMASGVRTLLGADVGLSVTGVAGPQEQDGQPAGTVFVGLAVGDDVEHVALHLPGDRPRIRSYSAISALDALRRKLDSLG